MKKIIIYIILITLTVFSFGCNQTSEYTEKLNQYIEELTISSEVSTFFVTFSPVTAPTTAPTPPKRIPPTAARPKPPLATEFPSSNNSKCASSSCLNSVGFSGFLEDETYHTPKFASSRKY